MPTERLSMRKTREILRLKWQQGRSHREIARTLALGVGTPSEVAKRARAAGLASWEAVDALSDEELDGTIYRRPAKSTTSAIRSPTPKHKPDPARIHIELRRHGVTLRLLHEEYLQAQPGGYGYTRYVALYNAWAERLKVVMRQVHKAGEKCFVDYSGKKPSYVDPTTGERVEVELFVAVMGASNFTYAEVTATQQSADWIASHVRLLESLGGVPRALVPDQLKSGVVTASRFEPTIQRTYEEWSQHYATTILPARPGKPRDKAKVEGGVLIAQRWILGRLRNVTCFSIAELNEQISLLLVELNSRVMKRYGKSRRALFDELDLPALAPLRSDRFVHGDWSYATVGYDYHVNVDEHHYSVPYTLVGEPVEIRRSAATIEVFSNYKRVASHARSFERAGTTTLPAHMPASHRKHAEESVAEIDAWAQRIGPCTVALVRAILDERRHPEHGYRSCRGLKSLTRRYTPERIEAASERALIAGARSYRHVESILRNGLDRQPLPVATTSGEAPQPLDHENIRGSDYYH
jgi:transposase